MKENYWKEKIVDYVEGTMSLKDRGFFEANMADSPELQNDVDDYKAMLGVMIDLPEHQPSDQLSQNFSSFLELEKEKIISSKVEAKVFSFKYWSQVSAAAVILLLGIFIGTKYCNQPTASNTEIQKVYAKLEENKKMMMKLLEEKSTSSRITAVNYSYQMDKGDDEIYDALIKALNTDKSPNVRLAAMEGLSKFADDQKVRNALIYSLEKQTEPVVQINLINILVSLNEKKAIPQMEKIIDNNEVLDKVKDEARLGIFKMS